MGRYWSTNTFDGKFGFGVQNSGDPVEFFGMDVKEEDDTYGVFVLKSSPAVLTKIHKQLADLFSKHDVNGKYWFHKSMELDDYIDVELRSILEDESGKIPEDYFLDLCRLHLGLAIYNDLVKYGFCECTADY